MIEYKTNSEGFFELLKDYSEDGIHIKKGWEWDGCSIPLVVRWFIKPTEKTKEASMVHDWIYQGNTKFSREFADDLFYKKLREDNVKKTKAKLMYTGVRSFGFMFYHNYNKDMIGIGD